MIKPAFTRRQFMQTLSASALTALIAPPFSGYGLSPSNNNLPPEPGPPAGHPRVLSLAARTNFVKLGGQVYGAKANERGPIGGGKGYQQVITKGDYTVQDVDGLLEALSKAKAGETVFIAADTLIDLTARVYIDALVLVVPAGVTLAGNRGHQGASGPLLTSDALKTPVLIRAGGPQVRITGLRIQGPNPKRYLEHHRRSFAPAGLGRNYYYKFPVSRGIVSDHAQLEVDNCEISAFSGSGIYLTQGEGQQVHHNYIHHCQYNGLGYGVSLAAASCLIEYNLFDSNRHSIAGTGQPGCSYMARHNVELGVSLSHCFDMHGGRDRKDGTDIAGTAIAIYNNTFWAPERAVVIRGVPEQQCAVYHNWFPSHADTVQAVRAHDKTNVYNNAYGERPRAAK